MDEQGYIRIRNFWDYQNADAWKKAQANKGGARHPAWCKLYAARDLEIDALPVVTRLVWYELLRLATVNVNAISIDSQALANQISIDPEDIRESIEMLIKGGWLVRSKTKRLSRIPSRTSSRAPLETFYTDREKNTKKVLVQPIETPAHSNGTAAVDSKHLTRDERKRLPGHCPECGVSMMPGRTVAEHLYAVHDIRSPEVA